jgi:hypothetical protein
MVSSCVDEVYAENQVKKAKGQYQTGNYYIPNDCNFLVIGFTVDHPIESLLNVHSAVLTRITFPHKVI